MLHSNNFEVWLVWNKNLEEQRNKEPMEKSIKCGELLHIDCKS